MHTALDLVSAATVVLATWVGVAHVRRRGTSRLALPLAAAMLGAAWWAAMGLGVTLAATQAGSEAFFLALLPGAGVLVLGAFCHAVVLSGHGARVTRRLVALLALEPLALVVLALTPGWRHVLLTVGERTADGGVPIHLGPGFWAHTVYSYVLLGLAAGLHVGAWRRAVTGQRWQYGVTLGAMVLPVVGNVTSIAQAGTTGFRDLTSVAFVLTAGLWWWVERHGTAMAQVPVSTRQVIEAIGDAVMVLDVGGRVVQANPAAQAMLGPLGSGIVDRVEGSHWTDLLEPDRLAMVRAGRPLATEDGRVLDVRVASVDAGGERTGTVVVVRDVTDVEQLRGELAEQAVRDGLTGVHNRRMLDQRLAPAVDLARATGRPLVAAMVDLDHFKAVNDQHGHEVGDRVLVAVADELSRCVRAEDVLVRFGGEEFLVLLPGARAADVAERAQEWRRRCARLVVAAPGGTCTSR
ncbi:MAG TPA: diguanylate cyclase [Actinotalea sp.]|nr:diguanylate cyclase [Actinotalea sp.]